MERVGSVRVIPEERKIIIEWKIDDFLRLGSNEVYFGPYFDLSRASGYLYIGLHGQERDAPFEYAYIYLQLTSMPGHCANPTVTFRLRTMDGRSDLEKKAIFHERDNTFRIYNFIWGSDLIKRKSELLPSGTLTVICTLKDSGPNAVSADDVPISSVSAERQFLEASSQTEEAAGRMFLDASAQTEEATGGDKSQLTAANTFNKLHVDLKELFLKQEDCDVILKVKSREFSAHRLILRARSPVFASAFRNDMKEKATGVINIEDCDPSSFSDFLCFLYCGNTEDISTTNVFGLFVAADKYDVQDLRSECLKFMKNNLSVDTFCDTIALALRHSEKTLIDLATDFFSKNVQEIITTVKWQTFLMENTIQGNELIIKAWSNKK